MPQTTRLRLYRELGVSHASADPLSDWTEGEWETINQAVEIVLKRMRLQLEVACHVRQLLPCDAIVQAGILSPDELSSQIADGRFDGQLCALPLRAL